jgi:hypothetical protein
MIEVVCSNGDRVTAPCPESAVRAALELVEDHWQAMPVQGRGRDLSFAFWVEGQHVRTVRARDLRDA